LAPNDAIIPDLLGGIPRVLFGSEFKLTLWLYALFGSFNGYVITQILMHVLAFAGMFRLSGLVFNLSSSNRMLLAVAFFIFALLASRWFNGGGSARF
jgi:hypothetical protein